MLGSGKSRGYCLEMICADFLAGANLDGNRPDLLLLAISRLWHFLLPEQRETFTELMIRRQNDSVVPESNRDQAAGQRI